MNEREKGRLTEIRKRERMRKNAREKDQARGIEKRMRTKIKEKE